MRRRTRRGAGATALALGLGLTCAGAAHAQDARYARALRDTLRYREVTNATVHLSTAQGGADVTSEHDGLLAIAFHPRDSASAWYEQLLIASSSPQGTQAPDTRALLGRPFALHFPASGHVAVRAAPDVPADIRAVTDLTRQFEDYFLRLPGGALARGRAWRDTVTHADSGAERWYRGRVVAHYVVLGDTVVAGERVVAVSLRQEHVFATGGPVPGQPLVQRQELAGTDSGTAWFSVAQGRLVARARRGLLQGGITFTGGAQPFVVEQRYAFESRIDRQP